MSEDISEVPKGLGMTGFIELVSDLSRNGYKCDIGKLGSSNVVRLTSNKGGFNIYFDSWGDVFKFNDTCVSLMESCDREKEEIEEEWK